MESVIEIRVASAHRSEVLQSGRPVASIYQEAGQFVFHPRSETPLTHDALMKITRHIRRRNRAIPAR